MNWVEGLDCELDCGWMGICFGEIDEWEFIGGVFDILEYLLWWNVYFVLEVFRIFANGRF